MKKLANYFSGENSNLSDNVRNGILFSIMVFIANIAINISKIANKPRY